MLFIVASESDIRLPFLGLSNKHREKTPSLYSGEAGQVAGLFCLLLWEGQWGDCPEAGRPVLTTQDSRGAVKRVT